MWVFVAENEGYGVSPDGKTFHVPKGAYFYQSEDTSPINGDFEYYHFDYQRLIWYAMTGEVSNISATRKLFHNNVYLRRLDVWNCEQYGWCTNPAGSHYSIRYNLKIYREDGLYMGYIGTHKTAIFKNGWGYTKQTSLSEIVNNPPLLRISGYRNPDGTYYWYDTAYKYFAQEEQFCQHPLGYIINTL